MRRDSFDPARPAWRRLLASTLVVVPIWWGFAGPGSDRDPAEKVSSEPTGHSVFVPGQSPSAAPDHAMLSAADVERALPQSSRASAVGFEANVS